MGEGRAGVLSSAEAGARRTVLAMGTGVIAWVVGRQLVESVATALIGDSDAVADLSDGLRLVLFRVIVSGWAAVAVPPLGYLAGRYFRANALGYAIAAVAGGEVFAGLAQSVSLGAEGWLPTAGHVIAEVVILGVGVALGAFATGRGVRAADRAQAAAQARADARAKELEAFTQQPSDGGGSAGPVPPAGTSSEQGKGDG